MTSDTMKQLPASDEFSSAIGEVHVGEDGTIFVITHHSWTCCRCSNTATTTAVIHTPQRGDVVARPFCVGCLEVEVRKPFRGSDQGLGPVLELVSEAGPSPTEEDENDDQSS